MTASETDETEHMPGMAASDFDQALAGMTAADFPDNQPGGLDEGAGIAGDRADNNAMIMGLPVMMKVVLGTAKMPVATLAKLTKGSVVKLDKMVGDSVDILVNGRLIARGEVVVLNEGSSRFGIVLTQVGGLSQPQK